MAAILLLCSQKGGVSKSTTARALAVEAVRAGLVVDVVDLDYGQGTLAEWARDRRNNGHAPDVDVRLCRDVSQMYAEARPDADIMIVDGPAKADAVTLEIARRASLLIQPTGGGLDDLRPAIRTYNSLIDAGVPRSKLLMVLSRVGSDSEAQAARDYLDVAGYRVADGHLAEKLTYRGAQNHGLAVTEVKQPNLKAAAERVIQSIIDIAVATAEAAEVTP